MSNSVLYSEINCVCILILILLSVKIRKSMFLQVQRTLFFAVTVSNISFLMLDAVWIFIDNNVISITIYINWILNCTYYVLSGVLGYIWFCFSEAMQESLFVHSRKHKLIALIPMIVLLLLTLISIKTGWLFYVDQNNVYHRGPAYAIQLTCSYGYVIYAAVKAFYLSFHTDNYRQKNYLRALSIYVLPTLAAGALQVFFPRFPILCIGNTLGILYVYLSLQEQLISIDALTKLNNRNQLYQYLSTKILHPSDTRELYLLMMDIDYFKSINDQYGHVEGDHALVSVANCLMHVCSSKCFFISRFGGDEFIVLAELEPHESIQPVCDAIHNELTHINAPYKLTLSIGYAKYSKDLKNKQDFIARADAELYKVKKNRK